MDPRIDPSELLAAQRSLRDRILGASGAAWRPARDLAAEMLLYLDDPQVCWRTCSAWLLSVTDADRVDAGFASARDRVYQPTFELMRGDVMLPTVLGAPMSVHDGGISSVWASRQVVVFADIEADRRLGPTVRSTLLAAGTRRKLAVALRDGEHEVGLLCADGASARREWRADECERLDEVARTVIGPVLRAARRIGTADLAATALPGEPHGVARLTPAELRVAHWVLAGCSYKEIARRLDRSPATVDRQLRSMREKLGVGSTAKLMRELAALRPTVNAASAASP